MPVNLLLLRRCFAVVFISFFALNVFPQQKKPNYSLLWKISGKGLNKPSYLFGTMHVKDKRVFGFSDSVMLCLQSCSRFALEVHPDTIMSKMYALIQSGDRLRNIDKLLSKDDYKKLAEKFRKKNGYTMGKIDPVVLESLMEPDDNKPDDKVSFIDAYLYGIARTLNKNIYGLEDASSQVDQYYGSGDAVKERLMDLLDENTQSEKDASKEEMIKIYSTGDLDAVYKYIVDNNISDSTIIARNKVMAKSMIRYMVDEPLFTAVGAAHLPGPDGVIALLRKAGYTVTRVNAGFTGVADTFHIDYMKMNWPAYRDEDMGYSINFPGTPIKNAMYAIGNIIYPDLANIVYYGLYALPKGTPDMPANRQEIVNKLLDNLVKNNKNTIISRKDLMFNNTPCTEVFMKTHTGYIRMRLIYANNILYSFYAGSKLNNLKEPYANRFFNSFVNFPLPQKNTKPWITYTNPIGAFTIKFPSYPQEVIKELPAKIQTKQVTFKLNMYVSTDTLNFKTYLVRYNDYPPGTFLSDKEALFNAIITDFKGKGKIISGPVKIWKDEYEGREIKVVLNGGYNADIRLFVRGNRVYILLKELLQADLKDTDTKDPFFNSFQLTPYTEPNYYTYQPDSTNFKLQMVSKPDLLPAGAEYYTNYLNHVVTAYSTNPNSGGLLGFEYSKISPYYRIENVDSLYKNLITRYVDYPDSILKIDTVLISGVKAREITTINKETNAKKRVRILINNDYVYCLTGHVDNSELFDKASNVFYTSLSVTSSPVHINLASSKAEKLCNDLNSTDTLIHKNAIGALSYYKFTLDEIKYVYAALQKNYPDDTLAEGARVMLIKGLRNVNDDSTVNILQNLYHNVNGKDEIQSAILNVIPSIDKKNGHDIYLKLFITNPPLKTTKPYEVFSGLNDSVTFAAEHFEQVLPFIKYDNYRNYVLRLANNIANEKNSNYDKMLKAKYSNIVAYAYADMDKYILLKDSDKNDFSSRMYNYMQLTGKIKFEGFNDKFTKRYLENNPKGLYVSDALVARINNNLPNNQLLINKCLDSINTRYDIMEAYSKANLLNRVPLKYQKIDEYAKLCLYQEISADDYGSPEKITLLGSILKNGSVYYVFKYLLTEKDEKNELIGITGPYKPGSIKLDFKKYNAYTDYDVVKTNWRAQATKMIVPLLEAYK